MSALTAGAEAQAGGEGDKSWTGSIRPTTELQLLLDTPYSLVNGHGETVPWEKELELLADKAVAWLGLVQGPVSGRDIITAGRHQDRRTGPPGGGGTAKGVTLHELTMVVAGTLDDDPGLHHEHTYGGGRVSQA